MVDIDITYDGGLHCTAQHRPSGARFSTDAPKDNQGLGASFSPTDLMATALGTCMATTMGILARNKGYPLDGLRVHVKKVMSSSPPRRVARLETEISVPAETSRQLGAGARGELEHAAHNCPVRLSVAEVMEVPVRFDWLE